MSAKPMGSSEDLDQFLQEHESSAVAVVRHGASCDLAPSLTALARRALDAGRPVRLLACDGPAALRWQRAFAAAGLPVDCVYSVREAALAVIAGAGAGFPRDARLLDANETDVLMEDLKVGGLKPGRLREMCKFFYKGIADGASRNEDWLISAEEKGTFALLTENLEARRAMLPVEVAAVGLQALQTPGGRAAADGLVPEGTLAIAPDFGTLSATAQHLVRALGASTLVACGAALDASNAEEDYPHPAGLTALAEAEGAALAELASPGAAAACETIVAAHPAEEFDLVANVVAQAVAEGTEPADITVACPHRLWMEGIAKRLRARGIPCIIDEGPRKAKGNPREEARSGRLRTRAAAKLLADPTDFTARRSWLGLGDWLVRSDAFLELTAYAREHGLTAAQALDALAALPGEERGARLFYRFEEPLRAFDKLIAGLEGATGAEACALLEEAGCELTDREKEALSSHGTFDAPFFAELVLAKPPADTTDAVALVPYRRAYGRHGKLTVICGLVSGFLPAPDATSDKQTHDHKRRAYDRDRLLFEAVKSTASDRVLLTRFTDDRMENADALRMDVARIYVKDGLRFASVRPSPYPTDATDIPHLPTVLTMVGGMATV